MWACAVLALVALTPQSCVKDGGSWPPPFCHDLSCPPFEVRDAISADPPVELRSYAAGVWVSTQIKGVDYEKAVETGFMRLFAYISGANEQMKKIDMTAPVRVEMTPGQGPFCEDHYKVSFYVPQELQDAPPEPLSQEVYVDASPAADYYVMSYGGRTNERQIIDKATTLLSMLDERGLAYDFSSFFHAGYDSPFRIFNRHNEVWVAAGTAKP